MRKGIRVAVAVLLILAIANYSRLEHAADVRTVEFVSILVIGALAGILLSDVMSMMRRK